MPHKKWIVSVFAVTAIAALVIWEAERCNTATEKCEASPTQVSSHGRLPSEQRGEEQLKAEQEKSRACHDAHGLFCKAVTPANLPSILLVIVGFFGIAVAVFTLFVLQDQANATWVAAKAAKKSAEDAERALVRLNRAYLTVDSWIVDNPAGLGWLGELKVSFRIRNPSNTAARIERVDYEVGPLRFAGIRGRMLTPGETHWEWFQTKHVGEREVLQIRGSITYRDIFRRQRHRKFAQILLCSAAGSRFQEAEGAGLNDEEEWDKD